MRVHTCAYRSGLVVGSSGFRMNKHCLNRDSGSPGARCAPASSYLPPCIISRSFRSEIRDFTSAYYAWRTAPRDGCVDPFRRSSYLSTFVTRSASWIDLNLSPVRDGSFTSFFPPFPFLLFFSFSLFRSGCSKKLDDAINVLVR